MDKKQTLYLDGGSFNSKKTFGKEIKRILFLDDSINIKNFNVVIDVLYGGYGILDYREEITLVWMNYKKSEHRLSEEDLKIIREVLEEMEHITLVFD